MDRFLPPHCSTAEEYFSKVIAFVEKYSWLWDHFATHLLVDGVLERIPVEWLNDLLPLDVDRLNMLQQGCFEGDWNRSLVAFLNDCRMLRLRITQYDNNATTRRTSLHDSNQNSADSLNNKCAKISADLHKNNCSNMKSTKTFSDVDLRGMSPKKRHEVERFVELIDDVASANGCSVIVDVGCGLGYLDQLLHHRYGNFVLGVDTNRSFVAGAEKRQRTLFNCRRRVGANGGGRDDDGHCNCVIGSGGTGIGSGGCSGGGSGCCSGGRCVKRDGRSTIDASHCVIGGSGCRQKVVSPVQYRHVTVNLSQEGGDGDLNGAIEDCMALWSRSGTRMCECGAARNKSFGTTNRTERGVNSANGTENDDNSKGGVNSVLNGSKNNDHLMSGICLVALHACGNLSADLVRLFSGSPLFRSLAIVPCCYHKIGAGVSSREYGERNSENNEPLLANGAVLQHSSSDCPPSERVFTEHIGVAMSELLNGVLLKSGLRLDSPAMLRLASEATAERWTWSERQHELNAKHVLYRAILQVYADAKSIPSWLLRKCCRVKSACIEGGFESYVAAVNERAQKFAAMRTADGWLKCDADFIESSLPPPVPSQQLPPPTVSGDLSMQQLSSLAPTSAPGASLPPNSKRSSLVSPSPTVGASPPSNSPSSAVQSPQPPLFDRVELCTLHDRYAYYLDRVKVLVCLQSAVQPVIEHLIIADRLMFLDERRILAGKRFGGDISSSVKTMTPTQHMREAANRVESLGETNSKLEPFDKAPTGEIANGVDEKSSPPPSIADLSTGICHSQASISFDLVPVFDPVVSPRCFCIIANKNIILKPLKT